MTPWLAALTRRRRCAAQAARAGRSARRSRGRCVIIEPPELHRRPESANNNSAKQKWRRQPAAARAYGQRVMLTRAQLECLLDDVVVGKQEMIGAIDAVCDVAQRIIGKLKEGAVTGGPPLLGATVADAPRTFPPTPAMKRFADSIARQKGIKPPPGYKTSISICRKFLNEHAP